MRELLPSVQRPTLVLHRSGDRDTRVEEGRYIAERIPGARFVELGGDDHVPAIDPGQILDEVEEFLTGGAPLVPVPPRVERPPGGKPHRIAVHLCSRGSAVGGEVLVSATTHDLVAGSGLEFDDRGGHELKGFDGKRRLFGAR